MSTAAETEQVLDTVVERFQLKSLVEACLLVEEGVATIKDIDMGMMMGAGIIPGPFAAADERGLDEIVQALENAPAGWGDWTEPPVLLRRLVAQGRLGKKSGQGFYAYPSADAEQKETLLLDWRDEGRIAILWLNRPPMNPLSPTVINELAETWAQVDGKARAMIIASSNTFTFAAGADIKEFTKMDEATGAKMVEQAHSFMRGMEKSRTATIAAVNSIALGGGCELAMACDFRIAAESAVFGQPEINLGIIPGFGGTQRLARLVGEAKALEMNLIGDPIDAYKALEIGLANEVVSDHELFDTALSWARKLADQAPIAIEQIKTVSANGDLDAGLQAEAQGFAKAFQTADAKEGIGAFLGKRKPQFKGE
jgi:enoyl-CoA hydratase / 3-hydroxyacyl-CoA dehydrogenase